MSATSPLHEHTADLALALSQQAFAIQRLGDLVEVLFEAMPAQTEADLLGVSVHRIRRARKTRRIQRQINQPRY